MQQIQYAFCIFKKCIISIYVKNYFFILSLSLTTVNSTLYQLTTVNSTSSVNQHGLGQYFYLHLGVAIGSVIILFAAVCGFVKRKRKQGYAKCNQT